MSEFGVPIVANAELTIPIAAVAPCEKGSKLCELHWDSQIGASYQLQQSPDLITWELLSLPFEGTGLRLNYPFDQEGEPLPSEHFFRVGVTIADWRLAFQLPLIWKSISVISGIRTEHVDGHIASLFAELVKSLGG